MSSKSFTNPYFRNHTPNGWSLSAIEDLCENVTSGSTPSRRNPSYYEDGTISWFKTQELKDGFLYDSAEKITLAALNETSVKFYPKNTVLMAMYGDGSTITSLGILTKEAASNQACCAMIPNPDVCLPRFLFYALRYHRNDFIQLASGGAQRNLSGKIIKRFALNTPSIPVQREITNILGSLDDKIELNRRLNLTLKAIAQAIFHSWFIDFDPVKAKQAALALGYNPKRAAMAALSGKLTVPKDPDNISTAMLDEAEARLDEFSDEQRAQLKQTAELFPSRLVESELGLIPESWNCWKLNDLCHLNRSSWTASKPPKEIAYVDLSNTNEGEILNVQPFLWNEAPSRARRILTPGDTIIGTVRPGNRSYALIPNHPSNLTGSTGFAVLTPKSATYLEFIYLTATSNKNIERLSQLADGAAYPAVRPSVVGEIELAMPPENLVKCFSECTSSLFSMIELRRNENESLSDLRNTLLPKLLSGEIKIDK